MIEGVVVQPLRRIADERGSVMHMLRASDPWFAGFGEIYFSTVYPGVVKGWHLHRRMVLNYAVPHGSIKMVLYDDRDGSRTKGELQEILQSNSTEAPQYQLESVSGPDHDRLFESAVYHQGVELGRGQGKSKKDSESRAALAALDQLRRKNRKSS